MGAVRQPAPKPRRHPATPAESGLVLIVQRPLTAIRPSPLNAKLYRPRSDTDPEIRALADSIRQPGLLEPLVISRDNYLLSGHRRHRACRLAGVTEVPCRVQDLVSTDPQFLIQLRESNRQRVKSF